MDYRDMTVWQLEQEQQKITDELKQRRSLFRVFVDPTMPADQLEIYSGPHRIRVTNIGPE